MACSFRECNSVSEVRASPNGHSSSIVMKCTCQPARPLIPLHGFSDTALSHGPPSRRNSPEQLEFVTSHTGSVSNAYVKLLHETIFGQAAKKVMLAHDDMLSTVAAEISGSTSECTMSITVIILSVAGFEKFARSIACGDWSLLCKLPAEPGGRGSESR